MSSPQLQMAPTLSSHQCQSTFCSASLPPVLVASVNNKSSLSSYLRHRITLAKTVSVVHANGSEGSDLRLSMATGVWIDQSLSIKPSFEEPGEVIDELNTCAKLHTNGLIEQILSHDSIEAIRDSKLLLANAVYFKGAWGVKFDPKLTKDNDFHLLDGTSVKVPFMTNNKTRYLKGYDGFQASDILMDMGLTSPFTHGGGLTEMVDSPAFSEKLHVSSIIHKAFIEVDEEVTKAAAVCYSTQDMLMLENPDFVADHSFLFTVREDKSGVILFMGQVLDPSKH
ncbi:hypothetical protein Bca4012_020968 [Brassica carinata]